MPPRWLCLLILVFWLGFNGWLFVNDLLPRLLPHQPPPYSIDLAEEAKLRRPYIDWTVYCDNRKAFRGKTEVKHPEHDLFELSAEFTPFLGKNGELLRIPVSGFLVSKMSSVYRVTAAGDLLGLSVAIEGSPNPDQFALLLSLLGIRSAHDVALRLDINGEVASGRLAPQARFALLNGRSYKLDLPEVAVSRGGSVLLPLHPVNRIRGLRPGQSWHQRVLDPLGDSLQAMQTGRGDLRFLKAQVRPAEELFSSGRRRAVPCLVVDYVGENFTATSWVERERGLVLRQEAHLEGHRWAMYRD